MAAVTAINSLGERAYNPRGNLWANDESTYGHKLLMKMGWSKGKGLGKNENGIKENLSVKFRNTNSGLGYKDDPYANLMKSEYESILKNLSDCYSQTEASAAQKEIKCDRKSEQKSRVVGSKLRYPKLFYGKDVSKYSEKDIKSIFICSQQSKDNQEIPKDKKESESELPKEVNTHSSTLSISDYFSKKMKGKKKNLTSEASVVPVQQLALDSKITKKDNFSAISGNKHKMNEINLEKSENQESINIFELQPIETGLDVSETSENLSKNKSSSSKKKKKSHINEDISNNMPIKKDFIDLCQQELSLDPETTKTDFLPSISNKKSKKNRINPEINLKEESITNFDLQKTEKELEVAVTKENLTLPQKYSSFKTEKKSEISETDISPYTSESTVSNRKKRKLSEGLNCVHNVSDTCGNKKKSEMYKNGNKHKMNEINLEKSENQESINIFELQPIETGLDVSETSENLSKNKSSSSKKKKKSHINEDISNIYDLDVDLVAHNINKSKINCQIKLSDVSLHQRKKLKKCYKERQIGTDERALPLKISQIAIEDPSLRLAEDKNVMCLKKKKNKKVKLRKLKSCLKSKSGSYSLKNVSFNKVVSYRIIDSCLETVNCQPVASSSVQNNLTNEVVGTVDQSKIESNDNNEVVDVVNKDETHSRDKNEVADVVNEVKTESGDNTHISEEISSDVNKSCSDPSVEIAEDVSDKELKKSCSLFSLPSQKSSHFNSWVESQRQALKMDLYKRMLKKIKKHEVLKSTNLLSIKGYGNWGFE